MSELQQTVDQSALHKISEIEERRLFEVGDAKYLALPLDEVKLAVLEFVTYNSLFTSFPTFPCQRPVHR